MRSVDSHFNCHDRPNPMVRLLDLLSRCQNWCETRNRVLSALVGCPAATGLIELGSGRGDADSRPSRTALRSKRV